MFTGLIERIGTIKKRAQQGAGASLEIDSGPEAFELSLGDSVAVDGVCLTVVSLAGNVFAVEVSGESLARSTLDAATVGGKVNLERALRLGDRLGGHLVTGHIDAMGKILKTRPEGGFNRIEVSAPTEVMSLVVEKGSISLDGISLTVNGVSAEGFWMMIIPETMARTTLAAKKPGDQVNLETDLIGKYVAKLIGAAGKNSKDSSLMKKLMEEGFI